eukprot:g16514.t1
MIHQRRVHGGGHTRQPTPTGASSGNSGFVALSHATTGSSDQGSSEAAVAAAVQVDGPAGDSAPAGAGVLHIGMRREVSWKGRDNLRGKVAIVTAIGVLVLIIAGERLTNILSSSARSTPLSPWYESNADEDTRHTGAAAAIDWKERVAGCTGPEEGFVYGGDAGKVLAFVRTGRREDGGGGAAAARGPALADVLRWFWKLKHDRGVLSYQVNEELETRREVGTETGWEVVFTRNIGRVKPFPPAGPAEEPWNSSSFNFYKASPLEFVLSYTPSFRHERNEAEASTEKAAGVIPVEIDAAARVAAVAAAGEAKVGTLGALRGAGDKMDLSVPAGAGLEGYFPLGCAEVSTAAPPQDAVLVNIRPVGLVSLLLTPGYPHSHHQRATAEALAVAMDFAEALRGEPGFRLGFNSAGSSASVNHLHIQCWYFDAGPRGLAIETSKSVHVATVPLRRHGVEEETSGAVEVHKLDGYPIRTLVFHPLGKDLEAVGEVIEKCVNFLVEENTPHTVVFTTGRVFLLPRQHLEEPPWAVVPGFPEVSGEIIVTKEEDFRTITADEVFEWWRDKISVSAEHFDLVIDACLM